MRVVLLLSLCMLIPFVAQANTPEDVVRKVINEMKSQSSLTPLLSAVDWDKRFADMQDGEKKALKIYSSSALRSHYQERVSSGGQDVIDEMIQQAKRGDKKADKRILAAKESMKEQREIIKKGIANTVYAVGTAKVTEDTAVVPVTKTRKKKSNTVKVTLHKSGGKWVYLSAAALNPVSPTGFSPVGKLVEPQAALFNH